MRGASTLIITQVGDAPASRLVLELEDEAHPEQLLWEVSALVDPSVHGDEALHGRLVSDVGVVQAGVQHDDGEGQDVAGVCGGD